MPPDAPAPTIRVAGPAANTSAEQASEILAAIDFALAHHAEWLQGWHRAVACKLPSAVDGLAHDPPALAEIADWPSVGHGFLARQLFQELGAAFLEMRTCGLALLPKAAAVGAVEPGQYDVFAEKTANFERLAHRIRQTFEQAAIDLDPLTGVRGRRNMMDELEREKARAARTETSFGLAMCDIDQFKSVNDRFGHRIGDAVLLAVVSRLAGRLRPYDSLFRYGGEEFLIALPDSTLAMTMSIAKRLCRAVRAAPIAMENGPAVEITASLGICMVDGSIALADAIERADRALYAAKRRGRNRVVAWHPSLGGKVGA